MISYNTAMRLLCLTLICGLLWADLTRAWFPNDAAAGRLPNSWQTLVIGQNQQHFIDQGDTLIEVARQAGLGFQALVSANPGVDPWLPKAGTGLLLPFATILPDDLQYGITINLAEYKLYLVWEEDGRNWVRIYPIGLGREGWNSPEGDFRVTSIVTQPSWTVPPSLLQEDPNLPAMIGPGPDNPLGSHWIGLSAAGFGIHGTNRPYGIGRRVSHGCVRLYPADITDLVTRIKSGTPVRIVYQPLKLGLRGGQLLLEAHEDFLARHAELDAILHRLVSALGWQEPLQQAEVQKILRERRGVPLPISSFAAEQDFMMSTEGSRN